MKIDLINPQSGQAFFKMARQVAMYGGLIIAAPVLLYFIAQFVFPALKLKEKKYIFRALFIGSGLFLVGISFCYFVLMPVALSASQMYSNWLGFGASQWRAEDYISFVCKFMLGMGLGFELPVVILTLVKIDVISHTTLAKARRYMIVINLIPGAVLTTPEVVTQILMFIPLQFLYEATVSFCLGIGPNPTAPKPAASFFWRWWCCSSSPALLWAGYEYGWPLIRQRIHGH